jgi:hypothetical protein
MTFYERPDDITHRQAGPEQIASIARDRGSDAP